jgi:hypothetical protein
MLSTSEILQNAFSGIGNAFSGGKPKKSGKKVGKKSAMKAVAPVGYGLIMRKAYIFVKPKGYGGARSSSSSSSSKRSSRGSRGSRGSRASMDMDDANLAGMFSNLHTSEVAARKYDRGLQKDQDMENLTGMMARVHASRTGAARYRAILKVSAAKAKRKSDIAQSKSKRVTKAPERFEPGVAKAGISKAAPKKGKPF